MKALSIRQLAKTYKNGVQALKGIDLEVAEGDFFALLGPNGAGKSTTIGIIASLVTKSAGQVAVFGHDIDSELEAAKSCLGLVPQEFNFNQFETVQQIVVNQAGYYGMPRREALARSEQVLNTLSLWSKRNELSRTLSGGMKRRLMIARALMHKPRLLILDEPTAGVDIEVRRSMWEFMKELNEQGTTIILTTHYLEEAESLCRNIAIIDRGSLVQNTSMRNLLAQLDSETFILDLGASAPQVETLAGFPVRRIDDHTLEIEVTRARSLNELFAELSARNLPVMSLRNKANRLEELFLRLTEKKVA